MRLGWSKRLCKETAGQEIAEAAVVLPILFLLIFGILWFARAYSIYSTLERAANAAALAGVQSNCATCSATVINVQSTIVDPILSAAHLDPTGVSFNMSPLDTPLNCPLPCANPPSPTPHGVVVNLSYQFGFNLNGLLPGGLTIKAEGRALQEN